ncbi:MAG TPA: hypothetical protein DCO75_00090 [Fibrobacteres bacterium]|nr:hypothetical protein [Fibrobacterota bacterium]
MSSKLAKLAKRVKTHWDFDKDFYNTSFGSVVVTAYMVTSDKKSFNLRAINKKFKFFKRNFTDNIKNNEWELNFLIDIGKSDYIDKVLEYFGVKKPDYFPLAMITDGRQVLFAPCVDGVLYPVRPDMFIPPIYKTGDIRMIDWGKKE